MNIQPAFSLCICCLPTCVIFFIFGKEDPHRTRTKGGTFFWQNGPWAKGQGGRLQTVASGPSERGHGRAVLSVIGVYSKTSTRCRKMQHADESPHTPSTSPCSSLRANPHDGFWSGHNESFVDSAAIIPKLLRKHEAFPNWKSQKASDQSLKETWPGLKDTRR